MTTTLIIIASLGGTLALFILYNFFKLKSIGKVPENEKIINLTDANFQQQIKSGVTLVDFWASWCMPCKMMIPILNDVANEIGNEAKICKLNIEQYQQVASKYSVQSIPTMLVFKNGREVSRIVGVKSKEYLMNQIHNLKYK